MSPGPALIVWCLLTVMSPALTLKQPSKYETIQVQPGEEFKINCSIKVCGGSQQGQVWKIMMKKWIRAEGTMALLAKLQAQNLTANSYDLQIVDSVSKDMNITASGEEPVTLQMTTREVQTDDAYLCVVIYDFDESPGNVSCMTRLLVIATPAVPDSTTDATRGSPAAGRGGSPKSLPTDEQDTTGSLSLMMLGVGMMAMAILLISANMILIILIYRKLGSRDLTQQTTKMAPLPDTLEVIVSNEPIYSVLKRQ